MRNFTNEIAGLRSNYSNINETANDDNFFNQKYGEIGINSRKDFYIWKSNITKFASDEEIAELSKKYRIKF